MADAFCATMTHVTHRTDHLPGHAFTSFDDRVRHLDEQHAMIEAMLTGWANQQQSRMLASNTIEVRVRLHPTIPEFTSEFPWRWRPGDVEDFTSSLLSGTNRRSHSTIRGYQLSIRLFCEFVTDQRYDWPNECLRHFGDHPVQICHRWNTVEHLAEFEGRPEVRALTYDEVQHFPMSATNGSRRSAGAAGRERWRHCEMPRSSRPSTPGLSGDERWPGLTSPTCDTTRTHHSGNHWACFRSATERPSGAGHRAAATS